MIDRCHNGRYLKRAVSRSDDHPGRDRDGRFVQRVFRGVGMPVGKKILMPMFQTVKEVRHAAISARDGSYIWRGARRFSGKANAVVTDTRMNMHSYEERSRFESELRVGDWECALDYYLPPGDRPRQPAPSGAEGRVLWALHLIINGDPLQELSPQVVRRLNRLVQNRHHPIWRYVVNLQLERNRRVSHIEDSMRYLLDGIHRAAGVPADMLVGGQRRHGRRYEVTREALSADDVAQVGAVAGRVMRDMRDRGLRAAIDAVRIVESPAGYSNTAGSPAIQLDEQYLHEAADLMCEPEWEYSEYDERSDADE